MRIQSLIAMGKDYLILGALGVSVLMVIAFVVYKFLLKGKKKFKVS